MHENRLEAIFFEPAGVWYIINGDRNLFLTIRQLANHQKTR
ncbi:hypothetical protein ADICYQ_4203 [Cyclobacterium qasimii M12-11B]|uniref:Uncharacterized protein n=1 Tax=Cyclobacterium qasimii M12-11B TaxID=641524 RepID=S7VA22_9BACT|nr:hypothetical protein ADICYQ_4203 [Cyclobacterium qasimii M12-11B]